MANHQPNIVVFFTDQQRWDTCGCYNPQLDLTPNLDAAAKKGVVFQNTYTCQPVCGPARAALQSGMYPTAVHHHNNLCRLEPDACTFLADYLNRAGYKTGYVGKWHLALTTDGPVPEKLRGCYDDYWKAVDVLEWASLPYEGHLYDERNQMVRFHGQYRADFTADLAIDYIHTWEPSGVPHMLFCSFIEPHHQNCLARYVAPDGYAERYQDAWVPDDLLQHPDTGDWKENLPDYYGIIKNLDENFGRVIEALKEKGLYENTIVIFTADHGSHFRTRNKEYKRSCHDACTRIPLVIHGPGVQPGVIEERLASLIDVPATILDLAGVRVPEHYHGLSLKPLLYGEQAGEWREAVFMQISEDQVGRAVYDGRYKYSVYAPGLDGETESYSDCYVEQYLYDLQNDPSEMNNLVHDPGHHQIRAQLAQALIRQIERAERRTARILPAQA